QIKAIIARDRHCRGCTAGPERCEIHHIVPWEQGGHTNIDTMCLACPLCHHNIHDRGYTVTKTKTGYQINNPNNPPNGP
ncbi:MAG: HNH endonuclease signature motif containing protein, partial [Acidimicrobiaceae bacterium]|nr:HNH endonuclease signature motif containing protein [Acidimicrobiaceae bacterium]